MIAIEAYETPTAVVAACHTARDLAPAIFPPDLAPDPLIPNVPAWYEFEREAWAIGETLRHSLKANPTFKRDPSVIRAILEVLQARNLRRGRQSFVMLLGFSSASTHAPLLASFITDPDIDGHVIDTLLKMRAVGYAPQVAKFTTHSQAWVRRLAKRYVERYPSAA